MKASTKGHLAFPALLMAFAWPSAAESFALGVSPPRFEISASPGQTVREIVDISHTSLETFRANVATGDWTLGEDGDVNITEALVPDSCRPWVSLERREIVLPPGMRMKFRFETRVPIDAPVGECRYVVLLEGKAAASPSSMAFDLHGRVAVVVYVRVGDARPAIGIDGARMGRGSIDTIEVLTTNRGSATGRLRGAAHLRMKDGRSQLLEVNLFRCCPARRAG